MNPKLTGKFYGKAEDTSHLELLVDTCFGWQGANTQRHASFERLFGRLIQLSAFSFPLMEFEEWKNERASCHGRQREKEIPG